jgi:hypothetical protein
MDCSLCAKGNVSTKQKDGWLPASAHNARGRKGQASVRITFREDTDHLSAAASLRMGIPKRRRAKARVHPPKSQAIELQSQISSSFFRPSSSQGSEKAPTRISDPSSLFEPSSTTESDFEADFALLSSPGTSTELEMEQEMDSDP